MSYSGNVMNDRSPLGEFKYITKLDYPFKASSANVKFPIVKIGHIHYYCLKSGFVVYFANMSIMKISGYIRVIIRFKECIWVKLVIIWCYWTAIRRCISNLMMFVLIILEICEFSWQFIILRR